MVSYRNGRSIIHKIWSCPHPCQLLPLRLHKWSLGIHLIFSLLLGLSVYIQIWYLSTCAAALKPNRFRGLPSFSARKRKDRHWPRQANWHDWLLLQSVSFRSLSCFCWGTAQGGSRIEGSVLLRLRSRLELNLDWIRLTRRSYLLGQDSIRAVQHKRRRKEQLWPCSAKLYQGWSSVIHSGSFP